jgi:hypothetical protein
MTWEAHVTRGISEKRDVYIIFERKPERKRPLGRFKPTTKYVTGYIKIDVEYM